MVTARKREETLQDVPLSVAAFDSAQLQGMGLTSDYDVANFTIGFQTLQQTGRDIDRPIIRGMSNPPARGEPNASYFIDGMFVAGSIATATTSAVERVEILRGPQSAQFGRATFSGAINYVTRKPTETFEAELNTRAGTHDDYSAGGWLSGPIVQDRLYFLASANWSKYGGQWNNHLEAGSPGSQGVPGDPGAASWESETRLDKLPMKVFLDNPPQEGDHSRLGGEETTDLLGKLVWTPWDGGEVTVKYGYTKGEDTHFSNLLAPELNCYLPSPESEGESWYDTTQGHWCGKFTAAGRVDRINLPDFRHGVTTAQNTMAPGVTAAPAEPGTVREQHRILLEYVQEIGSGYRLTARGGWSRDDFEQRFDLDHTETRAVWGLFHFDNQRFIEDYSAEVRLETPADLSVRGQIGLYWYDQDRENRQRSFVGPGVVWAATGEPFDQITAGFTPSTFIDTQNFAVFGGFDWDITDHWTLTTEARWARDEKDLSGGTFGNCDAVATDDCLPAGTGLSFDNFTPRITLRWQPTDDLTLYVLTAKGNKPGDFNTEFMRAGNRVSATNDAFFEGCNDPNLITPCVPGETLGYVEEEEQWTYELGTKIAWLDRRLMTNIAAYYIDWKNQGLYSLINILQDSGAWLSTTIVRNVGKSRVLGLELENSLRVNDRLSLTFNYGYTDSRYVDGGDPVLEETTGDGNLKDNYSPNVPKHSVVLGAYATAPVTDELEFFLSPDFAFNSKRYQSANNLAWMGNSKLLNLRAGLRAANWTLTAYVKNLLDDDTPLAVLDFINFGLVPENEPRIQYPMNQYGNLLNDRDPRLFSISPQRGRDYGVEFQYRFR